MKNIFEYIKQLFTTVPDKTDEGWDKNIQEE